MDAKEEGLLFEPPYPQTKNCRQLMTAKREREVSPKDELQTGFSK